jgi:hypothetical protein
MLALDGAKREVPTFPPKGQNKLLTVVPRFDKSESIVKVAAIKMAVNNLFYIRSQIGILPFKRLITDLFKCFSVWWNKNRKASKGLQSIPLGDIFMALSE